MGRSFDLGDFHGDGAPERAVSGRVLESGFYDRGHVSRGEVDGRSLTRVQVEGAPTSASAG